MPGSTPLYDFPFPLGSEPVGNGDNEIEDLALAVEGQIDAMKAPYGTIYRNTDLTSIVSTGYTKIDMTNDDGGVCADLANDQLVAPVDGHYTVTARVVAAHLPSGSPISSIWFGLIRHNAETLPAVGSDRNDRLVRAFFTHDTSSDIPYQEWTRELDLVAGDVVGLYAATTTTGGVNGVGQAELSMVKVW